MQQRLLIGSRSLVPDDLRGQLGDLRAVRLQSRRRGSERRGDRPGQESGETESVVMRSVRVFASPKLLEGFISLGYMKLGGVVVRAREYAPLTAYCAVCRRQGSHDTASHRFAAGGRGVGGDSTQ